MPLEKILFTTKFRELAFDSLESLFILKKAGLREVVLLHVILREDVGFVPFGGYLKEEEERLREEARIRFEDWQKSLSNNGIDSKVIITVGEPVHEVLAISEKEKVDLVVVGRKQRITIENLFAGSNTLQIITRSKLPTLVSKYMIKYEVEGEAYEKINDKIFERPMLVTDLSEESLRARDFLASLKGAVNSSIVFNNIDVSISRKHDKDEVQKMEKDSSDTLNKYCTLLKNGGISCESHLGAGNTVEEILRVSRERKASMIIMGTSGRGRIDEMLHGSISHQVAKMSELPTLLVP